MEDKIETIENNRLIAEFMGGKKDKISSEWYYFIDNARYVNEKKLMYHSSWDWLIPVVEKIAKIETVDIIYNGEDSFFDSYFPRTFGMINNNTKQFMVRINRFQLFQADTLIEATYTAVIEFIKWYNQKSK